MQPCDRAGRERGLLVAVLAGDERAWRTLYDDAFEGLSAYVYWRCGGLRDVADEVVQETWLTAVRRLRSFDPDQGSFLAWLRGIAVNLLRNQFRRGQRQKSLPARALELGPPPDATLEQHEQAELVARALAELPDHYEAVLRAKYLDGKSVAAIAAEGGESEKAIESLLTRARQAFRDLYHPTCPHTMHDITPDPLDSLLTPAMPPDDSALRQAVLARTLRNLRWRRRCRQVGAAAGLAACVAVALLPMCWAPAPWPEPAPVVTRPTTSPEPPPTALVREWRALDAPTQRAGSYRQAGDEYLSAEGDPQSAVRCYTAALDEGKPEELNISLDDSWLLMAIKEARQKEIGDAN